MIDMSGLTVIIVMFGLLIIVLMCGVPVLFAFGSIGVIVILLLWGTKSIPAAVVYSTFDVMNWYTIVAVPMFVFMAMILQSSGVLDDLFICMRQWLAPIPGGLAIAVIVVSVFIAAMSGTLYTGILTLGITAVPLMLKYGYHKDIAIGPVLAGGCMASLIPPSIDFIIYGALAQQSVGRLFMAGVVPGLTMAALFMTYIAIRCIIRPSHGPILSQEERVGWTKKIVSLRSIFLPSLVIFAVLGSLFFGVTHATEAAGLGALGAMICAAVRRKLSWQSVQQGAVKTLKVSAMCVWLLIGAFCFKNVFVLAGGPQFITDWTMGLNISPLALIAVMQFVVLVLGCFISDVPIMLITLPVFLPIVDILGFSRIWFGVLMFCNFQAAYLTPPFGFGLFLMRSVAPKGITMKDVIRSVLPFIPMQLTVLVVVLFFPQVALWLPGKMVG